MEAVIDGLHYDTETAERVATATNGRLRTDAHYREEHLYRTPNGRWFLHGEGGALTDYAERAGDMRTNGEALRALEPEEAMTWLEQHGEVEALKRHFADAIEEA